MSTDLFKLIFQHDQRLDKLSEPGTSENPKQIKSSIEDFIIPDPTYSRFYFSGTDLKNEQFGLNTLSAYDQLINALGTAMQDYHLFTFGDQFTSLNEAISSLDFGETVVLNKKEEINFDISDLHVVANDTNGYNKEPLKKAIETGNIILYKVKARDGFDLQMFSMKNIYRDMFFPLQKLVPDHFRFFSINGKKFNTERHFYFETWTLDRPPHGFEEVHPETVL